MKDEEKILNSAKIALLPNDWRCAQPLSGEFGYPMCVNQVDRIPQTLGYCKQKAGVYAHKEDWDCPYLEEVKLCKQ